MKILLVISDQELCDVLTFSLESKYGAEVVPVLKAAEALKRLMAKERFDVIVADYPGNSEAIISHVLATNLKIPCLIHKKDNKENISMFTGRDLVEYDDHSNMIENLFGAINKIVSETNIEEQADEREFCRIKTNLLLKSSPLQSDVFIRLSQTKYLRLFQKGDVFDRRDFERYMNEKKIPFFFLRKKDASQFVKKFVDEVNEMTDSEDLKDAAAVDATINVQETFQELIGKLGPTPEVQELAKANVKLAMKTMSSNRDLAQILKDIQKQNDKYIASHSTMLGFFACFIASGLKWDSATTFHKLTLAAFLHDVSLSNQELAAIPSKQELEKQKMKFTEEEHKKYLSHPLDSAELVRRFTEIPPDVDIIVAQHHERPDGTGFPRHLGHSYMSPLSAVFIIAHELVDFTYKKYPNMTQKQFIEDLEKRFNVGNFKKAIRYVRDHFQE